MKNLDKVTIMIYKVGIPKVKVESYCNNGSFQNRSTLDLNFTHSIFMEDTHHKAFKQPSSTEKEGRKQPFITPIFFYPSFLDSEHVRWTSWFPCTFAAPHICQVSVSVDTHSSRKNLEVIRHVRPPQVKGTIAQAVIGFACVRATHSQVTRHKKLSLFQYHNCHSFHILCTQCPDVIFLPSSPSSVYYLPGTLVHIREAHILRFTEFVLLQTLHTYSFTHSVLVQPLLIASSYIVYCYTPFCAFHTTTPHSFFAFCASSTTANILFTYSACDAHVLCFFNQSAQLLHTSHILHVMHMFGASTNLHSFIVHIFRASSINHSSQLLHIYCTASSHSELLQLLRTASSHILYTLHTFCASSTIPWSLFTTLCFFKLHSLPSCAYSEQGHHWSHYSNTKSIAFLSLIDSNKISITCKVCILLRFLV